MSLLTAYHLWWLLGLVLIGLEVALPGYFLLWIGIGAAATGALVWSMPDMSLLAQAIAFAVLAFLACGIYAWELKPRLRRGEEGLAQVTQVMRLPPGDVHLARLCEADAIADRAIAGELGLREGFRLLRELGRPDTRRAQAGVVGSYGLSAASVAALFLHSSWADLVVAGAVGLVIGLITVLSSTRPRLAAASEAISALVATAGAILVSAFVVPLAIKSVVLAALIVLVPGMSLTTAVREISSQHLVSGMARMGGAIATLLKLTFGAVE